MSTGSSAASTNPSSKPGARSEHVVIVGGSEPTERLAEQVKRLGFTCKMVPTYLSALGELSTEHTDVLIGPADAPHGSIGAIVEAARSISPNTWLVAVCKKEPAEYWQNVTDAGFDDVIYHPVDQLALKELLDCRSYPLKAPSESINCSKQETTESLVTNNTEAQPTAIPTANEETDELGDVDLADALLSPTGNVAQVALRMIESHTGLKDVGLRPADGEAPQGDVSVPVRYQGKCLARLHAPPPATEDDLYAWAEWLGRWLALREQFAELTSLALRDELTGVWNRRYFNRFLERIIKRASNDRSHVTLMIFDIDDFKLYNDKYGHGTGDEVLRETARLMVSVVREQDVVARIGGDEFAVIFWDSEKPRKPNSEHPQDVVAAARRFQEAIYSHKFPKLLDKAVGRLTVSGGLASFPWDGRTAEELLQRADAMALQSKRQGKNAITFGTGPKRAGQDR